LGLAPEADRPRPTARVRRPGALKTAPAKPDITGDDLGDLKERKDRDKAAKLLGL
jgi:hypothetical protein